MNLTYLGHSAFEIETGGKKILIDPFLVMSPDYNFSGVTDIFVTHAHSDHLGSAIEISKKTGAVITAIFELANYCASKGAKANGINFGGKIPYDWGNVSAVPAFHSSSTGDGIYGGAPCGFVFEIENKILYHSGDTCLNSEMRVIGEYWNIDIAMLPIGGFYTMDIEQAAKAAEWLNATAVIPMHYDTFPAINADIENFSKVIKRQNKTPLILKIRDSIEI